MPGSRTLLRLAVACFCSLIALAQSTSFTVGTATATSGRRATGFIEVPAGVDAATSIPVAVIHGARPGPVLALVAGAHGAEYASIIALERLIPTLNPAEMSGTIIILPLVNVSSFQQKVPHLNPVDGKNMNRTYPGKPDGSQSERAAGLITRLVVEKCDYLIDLHGGDLDESLRPYAYWTRTGTEKLDAAAKEMVLAFGLDHIIVTTDRPKDPNASRYLETTGSTRGKPSITVEAGYAGTTEPEDVQALIAGCLSVMRHLKMLPGPATMIEHPVWIGRLASVTSDQTGIFYALVRRGTFVQQGMKIGYVTDYFGNTIGEARAPASGVVLHICSVPSMKKGDNVANIGEITTSPE